ncbi:hypothetical protein RJ55_06222 [Drechmeria coniospora]|nr:hypothetical protein RJ55_06222 [Drechmeria coniospora]
MGITRAGDGDEPVGDECPAELKPSPNTSERCRVEAITEHERALPSERCRVEAITEDERWQLHEAFRPRWKTTKVAQKCGVLVARRMGSRRDHEAFLGIWRWRRHRTAFHAHHFQRTIPFTVRYLQRLFHLDARSVTFATHHLQPVLQPPGPPSSACSAIVISSKTRHGEFQGDTTVSACLFVCPGAAVPGDVVSRGRRHHDGESSAKERPNFDLQSMDTVDEVEDEVKDERGLAFTARQGAAEGRPKRKTGWLRWPADSTTTRHCRCSDQRKTMLATIGRRLAKRVDLKLFTGSSKPPIVMAAAVLEDAETAILAVPTVKWPPCEMA